MDRLLGAMHDPEFQKRWVHLEQYYMMMEDITKSSFFSVQYLLDRPNCIVTELCDMMLMDKSPLKEPNTERVAMGGSAHAPYFKPLISMTSYLIMSMRSAGMPDDIPTLNKFKKTYEAYEVPKPLDEKYLISKLAKDLFTHKDIMVHVLKQDWDIESYGKAISHICYGDKRLSKNICLSILKAISDADQSKVEGYVKIVESLCLIQDRDNDTKIDLQKKRLEWIFGFPLIDSTYCDFDSQRLGIDMPNYDIRKEIYSYRTAVTSDHQNNISLLHMLWRYQGRIDQLTLTFLNVLINIITSQESIMSFFSKIPGPNYQFARYTDWIYPYLMKQMSKVANMTYSVVSKEEIV